MTPPSGGADPDMVSSPRPAPEGAPPVTVLVVDDHEMIAECIVLVLAGEPDLVPVGIACRLTDAIELVESLSPDVVLLDDTLPGVVGTEGVTALLAARPESQILLMTSATAAPFLTQALGAGAAGFVFKTDGVARLMETVRACARGGDRGRGTLLPRHRPGAAPTTGGMRKA